MNLVYEVYFPILGIFTIIPLNYYHKHRNTNVKCDISINDFNSFRLNLISTKEGLFPREHFLLNTPRFSKRKRWIKFFRTNYLFTRRPIYFSIVIATYERPECFKRAFYHLIKNRPKNAEIIISDDSSRSHDKNLLLKKISKKYKKDDVFIIQHNKSFGAFHTKLDGFLFSEGFFIMSIDDDDFFDDKFYIEMAHETIKSYINNKNVNFVIASHFPFIEKWVKLPVPIEKMIGEFHNHYNFAFRRNLLSDVDYPPHEVTIIRDDAPLMIPLYIKTKNSQVLYYKNKYKYIIDGLCETEHQSNSYYDNFNEFLNGYRFLFNYIRKINRTDVGKLINNAYKDIQDYLKASNGQEKSVSMKFFF